MEDTNHTENHVPDTAAVSVATNEASENEAKRATTAVPEKAKEASAKLIEVRIPRKIFEEHIESLPMTIRNKAKKVGLHRISDTKVWGPLVSLTEKEADTLYTWVDRFYHSKDGDKNNVYPLRETLADKLDKTVNKRAYKRKAANDDVQEELAASVPAFVPNIDKANSILDTLVTALEEDGKSGLANIVRMAQSELKTAA